MMTKITRRDFLKLSSLVGLGALLPGLARSLNDNNGAANIIIILFDAMSAKNMSLYGYQRETTPNLTRFAERSVVFNNHYSGGNFTTPGTACMLSGMFQWKHRALSHGGLVRSELVGNNFFTLLGDEYYRLMFSQNPWPDRLVSQYYQDVDRFLPITSFSLRGNDLVMDKLGGERYLASVTFDDFLLPIQSKIPASALFGYLNKSAALYKIVRRRTHPNYPTGVPEVDGVTNFLNKDIYRGVKDEILALSPARAPFFSYFHLWSPHAPYKVRRVYSTLFRNDGYMPVQKKRHPYAPGWSEADLIEKRLKYDRQIAHVDAEFGNLINDLEDNGVLENSYLIVTSDHGEMFERGFAGHGEPLMYEPGIKIPLLIHSPGQAAREDVDIFTSNVDLLPTVLKIAGKSIPSVLDGRVLPGFGGAVDNDRSLYSMYAVENSQFLPLTRAAISMHKNGHKLIAYLGYQKLEGVYEFYDLENDPEELDDIADSRPALFNHMLEEFLDALADANRPFL